jgi:hypothetical protein
MEQGTLAIIIGVISSLIATAIFILISELFRRWVLPSYADFVYRGLRIDGEWRMCQEDDKAISADNATVHFFLKQKSDRISGSMIIGKPSEKIKAKFVIAGHIRDGHITYHATPESFRFNDVFCGVFKTKFRDNKQVLVGRLLSIESGTSNLFDMGHEYEFCQMTE